MDLIPLVLDLMREYPRALQLAPPGGDGKQRDYTIRGGGLSKAPEAIRQRREMCRRLRQAGATRPVTASLLGVSLRVVDKAGR